MDRFGTGDVALDAPRLIASIVDRDREAAGISVLALSRATDIPRESLRRRLATGDLTVSEVYKIARALGARVSDWHGEIESLLAVPA